MMEFCLCVMCVDVLRCLSGALQAPAGSNVFQERVKNAMIMTFFSAFVLSLLSEPAVGLRMLRLSAGTSKEMEKKGNGSGRTTWKD